MGGKRSIGLIRRMLWPALAVLVVGNFAGYAIAGPNGLLAWGGYHRDFKERKVELAKLQEQKLTGPKETIRRARQLRATMSKPERLLWSALRGNKTGLRFRKQHPAGRYVLDFYCDSAKLCVEIDGQTHDFTVNRDEARDRWLTRQGVRTLRIPAREVLSNLEGVVQYIATAANAPSDPLRGPPPPAGEGLNEG